MKLTRKGQKPGRPTTRPAGIVVGDTPPAGKSAGKLVSLEEATEELADAATAFARSNRNGPLLVRLGEAALVFELAGKRAREEASKGPPGPPETPPVPVP